MQEQNFSSYTLQHFKSTTSSVRKNNYIGYLVQLFFSFTSLIKKKIYYLIEYNKLLHKVMLVSQSPVGYTTSNLFFSFFKSMPPEIHT